MEFIKSCKLSSGRTFLVEMDPTRAFLPTAKKFDPTPSPGAIETEIFQMQQISLKETPHQLALDHELRYPPVT
jgi:phosphosulfolactate synthase (CoM biosynthesis protein A)